MRPLLTTVVVIVLLVGCSSSSEPKTHYERKMELYGFDFTRYDDFLITPEGYTRAYESVGIIRLVIWPEMKRSKKPQRDGGVEYGRWYQNDLRMQEAVDSLHTRARELGADAIIRFEANRVTEPIHDGTRVGVQARGFAIDRKQP